MRLYDISQAYVSLALRAEDGEDVSEALAALDGELNAKAEGVLYVLRDLEGDAEKIDAEIKRLSERKRALAGNAQRIYDYLRRSMETAQIGRIKAPTFVITLSDGPERVEVDDEAQLPEAFVRTKREPNKVALLQHYKATGEIVQGTRIERSSRLTIR